MSVFVCLGVFVNTFGQAHGQTIINVPPSPSPTSVGANTIVNLLPTGILAGEFQILNGGSLNIQGGSAGRFRTFAGGIGSIFAGNVFQAEAENGGVVNVFGGEITHLNASNNGVLNIHDGMFERLDTSGAIVNIWGGSLADSFTARTQSQLTVFATEFRYNGNLVAGLTNPGDSTTITIPPDDVDYLRDGVYLSGVFENGVPFVLGGEVEPFAQSVRLVLTQPYSPGPSMIGVPAVAAPQGVHAGQTLVLDTGGTLPRNFTASNGSTVRIQGGTVGSNFEAIGANVDVTGGQMETIDAFGGTIFNISGNAQWHGAKVYNDSVVNINGGVGGSGFEASEGATVNLNAGDINGFFVADQATVNINGGSIDSNNQTSLAVNGSHVTITGGRIGELLGGVGSTLTMSGGTAESIAVGSNDKLQRATALISGGYIERLGTGSDADVTITGGSIDAPSIGVSSLRGRTILRGGAIGDNIQWSGARVDVHGYNFQVDGVPITIHGNSEPYNYAPGTTLTGTLADGTPFNFTVGEDFQSAEILDGVVRLFRSNPPTLPNNIHVPTNSAPYGVSAGQSLVLDEGGMLSNNFIAGPSSIVEIHGGTTGHNFEADRSQVTVSGGMVGDRWDVFGGAVVTVTGGMMGKEFEVYPNGILNIAGGAVGSQGKSRGGELNISGGNLGSGFEALAGAVVNISGGTVESEFRARSGSTISVTGGEIGTSFEAYSGSVMNIAGGHFRELDIKSGGSTFVSGGNIDELNTTSAAQVEITGGSFGDGFTLHSASLSSLEGTDFKVDGISLAGLETPGSQLTYSMASNSLFTGILADGTPFAFRSDESDSINNLKLIRSMDLPTAPPLVQIPSDVAPGGVRAGQTLTLQAGGQLPTNFTAGEGSTVNVLGGTIGNNFEAFAAIVNVQGGAIGADFDAFAGSEINVSGGTIGTNLDAYAGSVVDVTGGLIAHIDALSGSAINLSGGHLGRLQASAGSQTVWDGGTMGFITANSAAAVGVYGVDFRLNGVPIAGLNLTGDSLPFNIPGNSILTGTLADGTPLILGPYFQGQSPIGNGALTLFQSNQPSPPLPQMYHVIDQSAPHAVGQGQFLLMETGGQLPSEFIAGKGSRVQIQGGNVLTNFKAFESHIAIEAGIIGTNFMALRGADLEISGGQFGSGFQILDGAKAAISGGVFPQQVSIHSGAVVDIYGTSFLIGGQPISQLMNIGDSFLINQFNGQFLTAILRDGSQLSWRLSQFIPGRGSPVSGISSGAIITLHLVPEPITWPPLALSGIGFLFVRGTRFSRCASHGLAT